MKPAGQGAESHGVMETATATGKLVVEKVGGKSTVTRCFSKYPLKFIIPNKVGSSETDATWVYTITYGGGIVSGDSLSCELSIGDACTLALTTQASTKVYKSLGSKSSDQILEARIGSDALLAVIPDPVTCFSTARYSQKQIFRVVSDSNLVIVDWITSGRHESGEKWDFDLYKSTNHIFSEGNQPLFLDTVQLERGGITSIAERMHDYQVIAMVILLGPKLKQIQNEVQENVKRMMSEQLYVPSIGLGCHAKKPSASSKPTFLASCSPFGPKDDLNYLDNNCQVIIADILQGSVKSGYRGSCSINWRPWSHYLEYHHIVEPSQGPSFLDIATEYGGNFLMTVTQNSFLATLQLISRVES